MIAVVDSGANLSSVMAALQRLGAAAEITADAKKICDASHVLLPGVGTAEVAMAQFQQQNLVPLLRALTQPVLGICLGMQLLFDRSEEGAGVDALGILPGTIERLPSSSDTPVPHMGWNQIAIQKSDHPLLNGIDDKSFVYFVHSYAAPVSAATLAITNYGKDFSAIVGFKNFFGCQFHPERSSIVGSQILKNFLEL